MATGEIAIGTVATSTSTTTITLIKTTISTATSVARVKVIGSIIRNIAEMRHMATEEQQTSSVVRVPAEPGIAAVQVALAVPGDPVV